MSLHFVQGPTRVTNSVGLSREVDRDEAKQMPKQVPGQEPERGAGATCEEAYRKVRATKYSRRVCPNAAKLANYPRRVGPANTPEEYESKRGKAAEYPRRVRATSYSRRVSPPGRSAEVPTKGKGHQTRQIQRIPT